MQLFGVSCEKDMVAILTVLVFSSDRVWYLDWAVFLQPLSWGPTLEAPSCADPLNSVNMAVLALSKLCPQPSAVELALH